MSVSVQLTVGGAPVPSALYDAIAELEIEENSDRPGTLLLRLPADRTPRGDLQFVGDGTFEPMTNIAVTVTPGGPGTRRQCVFDGYVVAWRLHLARASTSSSIDISAQDASWLMNLDDHVAEWAGLTDGQVANAIFASHGFTPAPGNMAGDSPSHLPDGHTLLQRETDLQFLRRLARRNGKLLRVACASTPGVRTGYFAKPAVTGTPAAEISLTDQDRWTVESLDFDWDVMRPAQVTASQVDLTHPGPAGTEVVSAGSGLGSLDQRSYPAYLGRPSRLLLTAPADVAELGQRGQAVLAESGFFARCTGESDAARIGAVLRAGDVVTIAGAGNLHSGKWLTWQVRHRFSPDGWITGFTLVRNAMGPAAPGGTLASLGGARSGLLPGGLLPAARP
jgi:phage protein D